MATHSSILAWEMPWIEEPGRVQFMGSQRVRHNWAQHTHSHTHHPLVNWKIWRAKTIDIFTIVFLTPRPVLVHRKDQINICWKREWTEFLNLEISGNYGKEIICKPRKICTKYIPYSHTASLAISCKFHSEHLAVKAKKKKKTQVKNLIVHTGFKKKSCSDEA